MSLVVAIKKDGVIYMGADTRTTTGDQICNSYKNGNSKINRVGSCLVGGAGLVSNIQALTLHPEWFDTGGKPLSKKFIVQNIIPKYFNAIKRIDRLKVDGSNGDDPDSGCSILITDGVGLFMIDSGFSVCELSRYGQIGCTKDMALAIFINEIDNLPAEELILKALRTSAYRDDGVGAPYILINTRDNCFEVVEE